MICIWISLNNLKSILSKKKYQTIRFFDGFNPSFSSYFIKQNHPFSRSTAISTLSSFIIAGTSGRSVVFRVTFSLRKKKKKKKEEGKEKKGSGKEWSRLKGWHPHPNEVYYKDNRRFFHLAVTRIKIKCEINFLSICQKLFGILVIEY